MAFLIGGANSLTAGYDIENSAMFNGDSSVMSRTPSSEGNRRIWTFSGWFKRCKMAHRGMLFTVIPSSASDTNKLMILFHQNDNLEVGLNSKNILNTNMLFRDPTAWYHIVAAADTTDGTAANRFKLYINGVQNTSWSTTNLPSEDDDLGINQSGELHTIGEQADGSNPFDGYMSEVHFIDGTQHAASSFGEFDEDSGIWKPKKYTGSYGTNGFFLEFQQTGSSANASGFGADTSGNDHHHGINGFGTHQVTTDTPTNNFATLNPLDAGSEGTLSQGNTKYTGGTTSGSGELQMAGGTFGVSNGKWYFEVKRGANDSGIGIYAAEHPGVNIGHENPFVSGWNGYSHFVYTSDGNARSGNANTSYGGAVHEDDIIGVALDLDNGAIYYSDNGTFMDSGDPTSGASKTGAASNFPTGPDTWILGFIGDGASGSASTAEFNFGNPAFSISSGNADANGYGNFEYAPPSGYYAPCTKNLAKYG